MRLRFLLRKEFAQFRRNPVLLRLALLVPLVQTLLLSYAANRDLTDARIIVRDEDRSAASRDLTARFDASPYFIVTGEATDANEVRRALESGAALVAIHYPPGFARDLRRRSATAQVLLDGSDSSTAAVAGGYLLSLAQAWDTSRRREEAAARGQSLRLPAVEVVPRVFYNPDLRSLWYMAPAVLALILTVVMQNLTALSIARERELGTLEQLHMTPLRPAELLLGKLIPFFLVGLFDAGLVTAVVVWGLRVPLRGSLPVLGAATILFLFAALGLGLLISAVSANQQQAQLTNFFLTFPAVLLSGFIFPVDNLPQWLQPLSVAVPMTHFVEIIRGVFLRGSGLAPLWPQVVWLAALAGLYFAAGASRFRKRLD